jgi:uncharacterized coiled-coil protein SlyX
MQTLRIPCSLLSEWDKKQVKLIDALNKCLKSLKLKESTELEERLQAKLRKMSQKLKKLSHGG